MDGFIPEKINLFNAYTSGNKLVGLTEEVKLPEFEAMTETISGPGILGEIDAPTPGFFGSMEQEIPFRTLYDDVFSLMSPLTAVDLTLRGSIQRVSASGGYDYVGCRVVMRGRLKKFTPGSMKQGSPMEASVTLELTYILVEFNGATKVELDKVNGVYKVNGVDILAKARSLT
jgi:P2 family phage contractile tail tube protein